MKLKMKKYSYWFKYINKTNMPIYDIKVDAYFLTPVGAPPGREGMQGGQNADIKPLAIKHKTYTNVPSKTNNDNFALHAVQVLCETDLLKEWTNPASRIRFEITAKHEVSGYSKVTVKDFFSKSSIKKGAFGFGDSLDVV